MSISVPAKSLNLSIKDHLLDKLSDLKIKFKIVIFQLSVITWQNSSTLSRRSEQSIDAEHEGRALENLF